MRHHCGAPNAIVAVEDAAVSFRVRDGLGRRALLRALDGVSLSVGPGETVALVGESGSGKTTLGRLVLGLQAPSAGQVTFGGEELRALSGQRYRDFRRSVQAVQQDTGSSLNPRHSVLSAVEVPLRHNLGLHARAARERAAELLDLVGLPPGVFAPRGPLELSGGQRQRVSIARALASEPRLIVADEAVSALDVSVRAQILQILLRIQAEREVSYLFITHDLGVVSALADRVAVLYLGRIVEEGPVKVVLRAPAHPYTRTLLAAVPGVDPARRSLLGGSEAGEIPSPVHPPAGCRFHTRCRFALDACRVTDPPVTSFADGLKSACHRAEQVRAGTADAGMTAGRPGGAGGATPCP